MANFNFNQEISEQDLKEIKDALDVLDAKLPYLISLSPEQKRSMIKLGSKSSEFVLDGKDAVNNFPQIFPPFFKPDQFIMNAERVRILEEIHLLINSKNEKIADTLAAMGSNAMAEALEIYKYVVAASHTQPGIKTLAEKMGTRFKQNGRRKKGNQKKSIE